MIDASYIKLHPHTSDALRGNQDNGTYKRGLNSKIHLSQIDKLNIYLPTELTIQIP